MRALAADREIARRRCAAFAVTDGLERRCPPADEEEWEYAALSEAAAPRAAAEEPARKRVIAAADVDPDWVTPTATATPSRRLR